MVLNGDLTIASDLDVYERVGRGVAHDEYIEFEVKSGKILYNQDETEITRGKMRVEFIKTYRDNPKVNAIILVKGKLSGKMGTKQNNFFPLSSAHTWFIFWFVLHVGNNSRVTIRRKQRG